MYSIIDETWWGYTLHNTLSKHGTVNRGVCKVDENNNLLEVIERIKIAEQNGVVNYNVGTDEILGEIDRKSSVSMNYWGFHPSIFEEIEKGLHNFMRENHTTQLATNIISQILLLI